MVDAWTKLKRVVVDAEEKNNIKTAKMFRFFQNPGAGTKKAPGEFARL